MPCTITAANLWALLEPSELCYRWTQGCDRKEWILLQVERQKLAMPECLQQQLINSRVVKPRGCNEETETGERHKGRSKGREGMKRYCKSDGSWRRGRRMFPAGGSPVSPVISVLLYGCSVSKMARPESFIISSV